jgi:hypothetical protein
VTPVAVAAPFSALTFLISSVWVRFKDANWRKALQAGLRPVTRLDHGRCGAADRQHDSGLAIELTTLRFMTHHEFVRSDYAKVQLQTR